MSPSCALSKDQALVEGCPHPVPDINSQQLNPHSSQEVKNVTPRSRPLKFKVGDAYLMGLNKAFLQRLRQPPGVGAGCRIATLPMAAPLPPESPHLSVVGQLGIPSSFGSQVQVLPLLISCGCLRSCVSRVATQAGLDLFQAAPSLWDLCGKAAPHLVSIL